jgi:hypothetical protein
VNAWLDRLAALQPRALYLNGDLFHYLIAHPKFTHVVGRESHGEVSRSRRDRGIAIHYVEGNRDFFLKGSFVEDAVTDVGLEYDVPAGAKRYLIVHGDMINDRRLEVPLLAPRVEESDLAHRRRSDPEENGAQLRRRRGAQAGQLELQAQVAAADRDDGSVRPQTRRRRLHARRLRPLPQQARAARDAGDDGDRAAAVVRDRARRWSSIRRPASSSSWRSDERRFFLTRDVSRHRHLDGRAVPSSVAIAASARRRTSAQSTAAAVGAASKRTASTA